MLNEFRQKSKLGSLHSDSDPCSSTSQTSLSAGTCSDDVEFSFIPLRHDLSPARLRKIKALQDHLFPIKYHDTFYDRLTNDPSVHGVCLYATKRPRPSGSETSSSPQSPVSPPLADLECSAEPLHIHSSRCNSGSEHHSVMCDPLVSHYTGYASIADRIDDGHRLVGIATGTDFGYVMTFGIHADFRRKGLGARLLQALFKVIQCDYIYLDVHVANIDALRFYQRLGFQFDRALIGYYIIEGKGEDAWRLYLNRAVECKLS